MIRLETPSEVRYRFGLYRRQSTISPEEVSEIIKRSLDKIGELREKLERVFRMPDNNIRLRY
jgi:hypothetical protein